MTPTDVKPLPTSTFFLSKEVAALVAICFIHFGDAVEIYLPSVLTQRIACDLTLSSRKQGILAVTFYSCYAVGSFTSGLSAGVIGTRRTIIASLVLSFVVTGSAALSTSFTVLVITRALTGVLVGSNYGLTNIYWTEVAKEKERRKAGLFGASLCFSAGAGYTSFLAYLTLDHVSWRVFFVICSLPIFLLPILLFVVYLPDMDKREERDAAEEDTPLEDRNKISKRDRLLILFLSLVYLVNIFQGWGLILLVPKLYHHTNQVTSLNLDNCHIVYGTQFIKMTLISGAGPVLAKTGAYILSSVAPYTILMLSSSLVSTLTSFSFIFFSESDIPLGLVKVCFAFLNLTLWLFMMEHFKGRSKIIGAVVIDGSSKIGALLGSAVVSFGTLVLSEAMMMLLGCAQTISLMAVWVITQRKRDIQSPID